MPSRKARYEASRAAVFKASLVADEGLDFAEQYAQVKSNTTKAYNLLAHMKLHVENKNLKAALQAAYEVMADALGAVQSLERM